MPHALHEDAEELLEFLFARFPMSKRPNLIWRPYRTTAGMAHLDTWSISLGAKVLITQTRMRETLLHEYAHLLAVHRHGMKARGHGEAWKQAMRDLGLPPEVHHQYECERNQPRQLVRYRCERCQFEFTRRRRLTRGRTYLHIRCGGKIRFVGVESTTTDSHSA